MSVNPPPSRGFAAQPTSLVVVCAALVALSTSCFDEEVRVCDLVTSAECSAGESCVDQKQSRCPSDEENKGQETSACITPGLERCTKMGTAKNGEACTKHTDCGTDMLCIGMGQGVCHHRCDFVVQNCVGERVCRDLMPSLNTPDDVGYCEDLPCNPLSNAGCGAGEACFGGPEPFCGPIGSKKVGEECKTIKDCAEGAICVSGKDKCTKLCDSAKGFGTAAGCAANESCDIVESGGQRLPFAQGICVLSCDVVTEEGCDSEGKCYLLSADKLPECYKAGTVALGETCFKTGDCFRRGICVQGPQSKLCVKKCDASDANTTATCDGNKCAPLSKISKLGFCPPKQSG